MALPALVIDTWPPLALQEQVIVHIELIQEVTVADTYPVQPGLPGELHTQSLFDISVRA